MKNKRNKKTSVFPLAFMEIGDSFLIPCNKEEMKLWRGRFHISAHRYKRETNSIDKKFSARKVDGGLRCWRVK